MSVKALDKILLTPQNYLVAHYITVTEEIVQQNDFDPVSFILQIEFEHFEYIGSHKFSMRTTVTHMFTSGKSFVYTLQCISTLGLNDIMFFKKVDTSM